MTEKKIDETLKELLLAILVFEIIAQIVGAIAVGILLEGGVLKYTFGLWIGALLAFASAYHMWWSIDRNLSVNADNEGAARAFAIFSKKLIEISIQRKKNNIFRFILISVV